VCTRKLDHEWKFGCWAWGMYDSKALLGAQAQKFGELGRAKMGRLQRIKTTRPSLLPALVAAGIIILCVLH